MKKVFPLVIALIVVIGILVSCGNNKKENETEISTETLSAEETIIETTTETDKVTTETTTKPVDVTTDSGEVFYLKGEEEIYLELGGFYEEPGAICMPYYVLKIEGTVDTGTVGTYILTYTVYTKEGEPAHFNPLTRTVHVVANESEFEKVEQDYYAGYTYTAGDFIVVPDNCEVTFGDIHFSTPGTHEIEIVIKDETGRSITYTDTVEVKFDFEMLVFDKYEDKVGYISRREVVCPDGLEDFYIDVYAGKGKYVSFFNNAPGHIYYSQEVRTELNSTGTASLVINALYGLFDRAQGAYTVIVSDDLSSTIYFTFDAVSGKPVYVTDIDSADNDANLDEGIMLFEANEYLHTMVDEFRSFLADELGIELK